MDRDLRTSGRRIFLFVAGIALATLLLPAGAARGGFMYQIDNNDFGAGAMNVSDTSETRDNWMGNLFTVAAGGETITHVYFQAGNYTSTVTVGIYTDNGDPTPPKAASLVYQEDFTMAPNVLNDFVLTTPPVLTAGDKMVVGILVGNVPGDQYPYAISSNTDLGRSNWDRDFSTAKGDPTDYPMGIGDLSMAVPTDQQLIPGGWNPGVDSGCSTAGIRAFGTPEPATLLLLGLGAGMALLRRRRAA
jgi:hypothetical protein